LIERLKEDMINLGEIGKQETGGISRPSFSDYDIEARKYVLKRFKEAGLMIHTDAAGNIIGIRPGKVESPIVTTGSHIDSVWNGGMFDGTLGVISGLEAIRMLNDSNIKTDLPIALIVFTDEEGAFSSLTGSSYFAGLLKKEELYELKNKYDGKKFKEGFEKIPKEGYVERFEKPIKSHVELHIEQGPVLESNNKDIGIVTGIVGVRWLKITFIGKQSHAGATPMNMRRDPVIPLAKTALKIRETALSYKEMVGTAGYIKVFPNVVNVIAGEATITADIRTLDLTDLENAVQKILRSAKMYAQNEKVGFNYSILQNKDPVICSQSVMQAIKQSTEELGYSYILLPSRAGHDTQNVAKITKDVGMIFVPSKGGISHSPDEWTEWEQAHKGVEVLKNVLIRLASNIKS
jgi:hydantoinase/carbamoylase family amidase